MSKTTGLAADMANTTTDSFVPRQSTRIATDLVQADGDTWNERLAVCEGAGHKLMIRSYYRNQRTQKRIWDEPPSGASQVVHSTPEMRKMAEVQLQELRLTLDMIPPDQEEGNEPKSNTKKAQDKKGLFGRFRKKDKEKGPVDDSKDLNLQRAIARSMADQGGAASDGGPVIYYDPDASGDMMDHAGDDEALAMAKALSISESAQQTNGQVNMTEEEMLQRALEESRHEANALLAEQGVATMPPSTQEGDLLHIMDSHDSSPPRTYKKDPNADDDWGDQKMPAKKSNPFDPYNSSANSSAVAPEAEAPPQRQEDANRKQGGRRRRMFGGRKNMEEDAGLC